MRKKRIMNLLGAFLIVLFAVSLIIGGCAKPAPAPAPAPTPAPAPPPEPIALRGVTFLPTFDPTAAIFGEYAKRVTEESNGQLVVEWVGGPEIVTAFNVFEAVRRGAIDIGQNPYTWTVSFVPEAFATSLAEMTPVEREKNGFEDWMAELYRANANVGYLGPQNTYLPFHLWSNVRVGTRDDLRGLKIGDPGLMPELPAALGATYVRITFAEVYSSAERGVTDAFHQPSTTFSHLKLWEVAKYGIKHGIYESTTPAYFINLDKWNSIPPHLQKLMKDVLIAYWPEIEASNRQAVEKGWQAALDNGVEVIEFSQEDAKWYRETAYNVGWESTKKMVSPDSYDRLRALLSK